MTTREFVHSVTGSYFRSRKKDGGHVTRSTAAENPTLHAHFNSLSVIDAELLAVEISHRGDPDLSRYTGFNCECTGRLWTFLLLWPWPWPDDLHIRTWPVLPGDTPEMQMWTHYVKAFESYRLTDRETDTIDRNYKPCTPLQWNNYDDDEKAHGRHSMLTRAYYICRPKSLSWLDLTWFIPRPRERIGPNSDAILVCWELPPPPLPR